MSDQKILFEKIDSIQKLIPSELYSWVLWRNIFTKPGDPPFTDLMQEMGLSEIPTSFSFLSRYKHRCPYCQNDGIVGLRENGEPVAYNCICKLLKRIDEFNVLHKLVRTRASKESLDNLKYTARLGKNYPDSLRNAVSIAKKFIVKPDRWLYLEGYYGCGKTHILKSINTSFFPIALYISGGELEQRVHEFRKDDSLDLLYNVMTDAPILIMDDLGMEHGGQLVASFVDKIIDSRYESYKDKPVVIASNIPVDHFGKDYKRATDRLNDRKVAEIVLIESTISYRELTIEARR